MPVAASQVFDFIEQQATVAIERHEIGSTAFGALRRSLRKIVVTLRDSDTQDALDISDRLRALLSEWLTVPVPFDSSMLDTLRELLGATEGVQSRWGLDIRTLYELALCAAAELPSIENPVREAIRLAIREQRSLGQTLKVYCSRRARLHFESVLVPTEDPPLLEIAFLHSVRDYRETAPFDVLIKVGPLRARGWSSAPDALLTAPRFRKLLQIVWSGCSDEPDFGYDPVSPPTDSQGASGSTAATNSGSRRGQIIWTTRLVRSGQDTGALPGDAAELDELRVFREMIQQREKRTATLVQVDEEHAILYPPHSLVLSFDPDPASREPIDRRMPSETLFEGMYLIRPLVDDVDFGGVRAEHGHYSQIWKSKLKLEWRANAAGLIARLRTAGLNLQHLSSAIQHWCKPPSTVIHAPQQMKHFEVLLRVLEVDGDAPNNRNQKTPLWKLAWNEVRRSRGEAIQFGVQEQEIVEEQLLNILRKLVPQIRERAMTGGGFHLAIPPGSGITGDLLFLRVSGIEEGFRVPETDLKVVRELSMVDQWRD